MALFVAAVVLPSALVNYFLFREFINSYIFSVTDAFGLPSNLAAAASVVLVPLALIVLGLVLSLRKNRRTIGLAILIPTLSLYYVLLWYGTRNDLVTADGSPLRCYTINADGVRFFERAQVDPRTGESCIWVNEENIRYVSAIDARLRSGEPTRRVDPNVDPNFVFFAPGTHQAAPLVWYVETTSAYEFFDAPGVHPTTGRELLPVTPAVVESWLARRRADEVAAEDARRVETERQRLAAENEVRRRAETLRAERERQQLEEQRRQELARERQQQAAREAEERQLALERELEAAERDRLQRIVQIVRPNSGDVRVYLVSRLSASASADSAAADVALRNELQAAMEGIGSISGLATEFVSEGYFAAIWSGDLSFLQTSRLFSQVPEMWLIEASERCAANAVSAALRRCDIGATLQRYSEDGLVGTHEAHAVGAGVTDAEAIRQASSQLARRIRQIADERSTQ
ncbi:hypothetical protein [Thalassovita taeanensis]|nr:hypothetical protein [Thalassovita taeanensis]